MDVGKWWETVWNKKESGRKMIVVSCQMASHLQLGSSLATRRLDLISHLVGGKVKKLWEAVPPVWSAIGFEWKFLFVCLDLNGQALMVLKI